MRVRHWLLAIAAFVGSGAPVWAQPEVLQVIPDDAIGFIVVNRIGEASAKGAALAKRMKIDMPGSPLELAKAALGLHKSLNDKGSGAAVAFAGKAENDEPRGVFIVPVTNYQTLLDELPKGETKDGITTITLKDGKEIVAGKRGNFAILTDAKDRELLARVLKANKTLSSWAAPLGEWLTENDATGVLTGDGIKLIGAKVRQGLDDARQNLGGLPPEAQFVVKIFDAIEGFIKSAETDVIHAGFGVRVDQAGSLHLSVRTQFLKGSGFAKAGAAVKAPPGGPLGGLPAGPFVVAMGGAVPENFVKTMSNFSTEMLKAGGQNIPQETIKKLEQTYAKMAKGMNGMSFVWQLGKENQPLFANMVSVIHITDANAYMVEYEKSIAAMKDLVKDANLPFVPAYDIKKVMVGGKQVMEMSADFAGAAGLPEEAQKIFKGMFGADGKMTISIAARDDKTILMRYTKAEGLKELLGSTDQGLGSDAGVIQASKALPMGSQWALYLSPKGLTEFADRAVKAYLPIPLNVPQFPATPPVAIGARISTESFELHIVAPAGVVDGVGEFVEKLKGLLGGGA